MPRTTPTRINADGEVEKQCGKCHEWLPLDAEFFGCNPYNGRLISPCKVCIFERRNRAQPCNVPGCTELRWNAGTSYCRDHHYEIRHNRPPKYTWRPKEQRL